MPLNFADMANNPSHLPAWQSRSSLLLGEEGLRCLANASVAVFGLGGVGSFVAEGLARAGVGKLLLVDGDVVDITNINRQLVALHSTVGLPKTEVMAKRIRDINPACQIETYPIFYKPATDREEGCGLHIIDGCDFVADAIDMVSSKIGLAESCRDLGIPLISAMGCGNKLDPTRFRVADIFDTKTCPLCRVMRRELKKRGIPSLTVVYSEEPPITPAETADAAQEARRAVPGSVSFVPSVAGLMMAGEIVRRLCGIGDIT